jgi:hypothetical protein
MIPTKKTQLAFNRLQDHMIIIDFNSDKQFHQVNEVGARIWELCDGKNTKDDIINILLDEYEIDKESVTYDTLHFLTQLKENDLLCC